MPSARTPRGIPTPSPTFAPVDKLELGLGEAVGVDEVVGLGAVVEDEVEVEVDRDVEMLELELEITELEEAACPMVVNALASAVNVVVLKFVAQSQSPPKQQNTFAEHISIVLPPPSASVNYRHQFAQPARVGPTYIPSQCKMPGRQWWPKKNLCRSHVRI